MTSSASRLALVALGLVAGFASGFLGVGGGVLIVPVLMIVLGHGLKHAVGASLPTVLVVSIVGVLAEVAVNGWRADAAAAALLTLGSLGGASLGGRFLRRLPELPLRLIFCAVLVASAYRLVAARPTEDLATGLVVLAAPAGAKLTVAVIGVAAGVASVLFGVGGGVVIVPMLLILFPEAPFHAVAATSLMTVVPTTALSLRQHLRLGTVDRRLVAHLMPFGVLGSLAGVLGGSLLPGRPCRVALASFLVLATLRLVTLRRPAAATPAAVSDLGVVIAAIRALPASVRDELHATRPSAATLLGRPAGRVQL